MLINRNEYASFAKIETKTIEVDAKDNSNRQKPKIFVTLTRHKNFHANLKHFQEVVDQNRENRTKVAN